MTVHSVAEAKANLPRLIDRALDGEEVVITRRGKPVAQLTPASSGSPGAADSKAALERLIARRRLAMPPGMNSVSLLNDLYDEA